MTGVVKFVEVNLGDVVQLRKPHPCGGGEWTVVRLGADIGLRCDTCSHRVLLARSQFEQRLKAFVRRAGDGPPGPGLNVSTPATIEDPAAG